MRGMGLVFLLGCADARLAALQEENETLTARLAGLEGRVATLEDRLEPPAPARDEPPAVLEPPAWVTRADDGTWVLLRAHLPTADEAASLARVIPHRGSDGRYDGYRLSGIRRTSGLDLLGFRNGDIVRAVDTVPMVSLEAATAAWATLHTAERLVFDLVRKGEPVALVVAIR